MLTKTELLTLVHEDENFINFFKKLEFLLKNESNTIHLTKENFHFIAKLDNKKLIEKLLDHNKKFISIEHDNETIRFPISQQHLLPEFRHHMFDRIETPSGSATIIGFHISKDWYRYESIKLYLHMDESQSIEANENFQKNLVTKKLSRPKTQLTNDKSYINRLIDAIQNNDHHKIKCIFSLMRLFYSKLSDTNSILSFSILSEIICKEHYETVAYFFKQLNKNTLYFDNNKFINFCQNYIKYLGIFDNLPHYLDIPPNSYNYLNHLRKLLADDIIALNIIDIKLKKSLTNQDKILKLITSAEIHHNGMKEIPIRKQIQSIIKANKQDLEMSFMLLNNYFKDIVSEPNKDFSNIQSLLKILELICFDEDNENKEQLQKFFRMLCETLFSINFDNTKNKTLFEDNNDREKFFSEEIKEFTQNDNTQNDKFPQDINSSNNNNFFNSNQSKQNSYSFSKLEFLIYDLKSLIDVYLLLSQIKSSTFKQESKGEDLLDILLKSDSVQIKAKVYYIKAQLSHESSDETSAFLFLSKAFLLNADDSSNRMTHYEEFPEFQFVFGFKEFQQGNFIVPDIFQNKEITIQTHFLENLCLSCPENSELTLYLRMLYACQQSSFHNRGKERYWREYPRDIQVEKNDLLSEIFKNISKYAPKSNGQTLSEDFYYTILIDLNVFSNNLLIQHQRKTLMRIADKDSIRVLEIENSNLQIELASALIQKLTTLKDEIIYLETLSNILSNVSQKLKNYYRPDIFKKLDKCIATLLDKISSHLNDNSPSL